MTAVDGQHRALLIWRHRFITGRWGWEVPMAASTPAKPQAGLLPGNLSALLYLLAVRPV